MELTFTVPGKPFGKQRPRVTMRKSRAGQAFATAYTPKETVNYENLVKVSYANQCRVKLNGPIDAKIIGVFPIPKATSKIKYNAMTVGDIHYVKKIDCDNMAKTVLDALNGIAYDDDSQIFRLSVEKWYGENPRVIVRLREEPDAYGAKEKLQ